MTLSQAVKDGSFFVVTPSSIPSSTTLGPNANSSSEGSNKVLEDSDDKPTMKKRISDSDEEEGGDHEAEFRGMYLPYFVKFLFFFSFFLFFFFIIALLFLLLFIYIYIYIYIYI